MNSLAEKYMNVTLDYPIYFGIKAGFDDLTDLHNEWLKGFLYADDDQTLLAHRGSYKTTTLAVAFALMIVLYPNKSILFFRKTDTDVAEIIVQTSKLLLTEEFQRLAMCLYGTSLIIVKTTYSEIDTNLKTTNRGSSQLVGLGIGASITGKHADIVATDDIVNLKDRASKAERDRTKLAYMELENIRNNSGRFINTGTPWHKEDAISIMPNQKKFDVYSTGLRTKEEIQALKEKMTPSLFSANYELKHIADEDTMFKDPVFDNGSNTEKLYNGISHIDSAYGGDDYTAFTILNETGGKIYVYGKLWHKHIDDCMPEIEQKRKAYLSGTLYTERNADKGYVAKNLQKPVETYHEKENKYIKISTYLRSNWKQIVFVQGTDPEYVEQIIDYTEKAEHDDAPDSLASLLRINVNKRKKSSMSTDKKIQAVKRLF